jgi:hypothetical protein
MGNPGRVALISVSLEDLHLNEAIPYCSGQVISDTGIGGIAEVVPRI